MVNGSVIGDVESVPTHPLVQLISSVTDVLFLHLVHVMR